MTDRYKDLNLTQLRAFCEFVRHRSFTDAARSLHVSHSAVWQQVRALERRFDVTLLERQGRSWRPTSDGETLLDAIGEILHSVDGLEDRFRRMRDDVPRTLTIIASPGAVLGELHGPIVEFRSRRPNCHICVTIGATMEQTTEQLLSGRADLAVAPESIAGQLPPRRSITRVIHSAREAVVAVPARHPLVRKRTLRLTDLTNVPLIVPHQDHVWRRRLDEVFRRAELTDRLQVVLEVSLTQAIRRWVAEGLGVGVFPQTDDGIAFPGVVLRPAAHLFPAESVVLLRRRGVTRPEVALFEELLTEQCTAR
jgi:DNA-binding transcriptional LysR family regulator